MLIANKGNSPSTRTNTVEYVTISTTGNAVDFGDMTNAPANPATAGNSIRGMVAGGQSPGSVNTIQYFTLTSLGNAQDFGDLSFTTTESSGFSSPIRTVWTRVSQTYMDSSIIILSF